MLNRSSVSFMLMIIIVTLAGCLPMNTDYCPHSFLQEKKALVIMRSFAHYEGEAPGKLSTVWDNKDTGFFFASNGDDSMKSYLQGVDNYFIYAIQPGKYTFRHARSGSIKHAKNWFNGKEIAAGVHETHYYFNGEIGFEVKPNEVVYLGDFILKDCFTGDIEIKDSFQAAEAYLKKKYPELTAKLKKDLIRIPAPNKFSIPKYMQEAGKVFKEYKHRAREQKAQVK